MRRDGDRIRAAREREREAALKAAEEEEREREKQQEGARREKRKQNREAWRRWARRALVPAEPTTEPSVRVTVRIASGQRRTRMFPASAPVEAIYAFVETLSIPSDQSPEQDPESPPAEYVHEWGFVLATTFPRVVVPCEEGTRVGDVEVLRGGVVLVVEGGGEDEDEEEEDDEDEDEE